MPVKSRWAVDIPQVSLTTYLFGAPGANLPDKPVFLAAEDPDNYFFTLRQYRLWCQRLAAGLRKAGLQDGDRVLLFSGNTLFTPVIIHGVIMAGGVFTGANPSFVPRELAYQWKDSDAKFLIAAESSLDTAREAANINGFDESRIFAYDNGFASFDGKAKDFGAIRSWLRLVVPEEEGARFVWKDLRSKGELNQICALNYSSGTTGVPKGVMITHRNYVANCCQTVYLSSLNPDFTKRLAYSRQLCFIPLYHAYGQAVLGTTSPQLQTRVYIMLKFDFLKMLEYIQKYRITSLNLVPPIAVALAKHPATKKFDLSSVESVNCGAAPLGREISVEVERLWPKGTINLKQGWGMTEYAYEVLLSPSQSMYKDGTIRNADQSHRLTCAATGWDTREKSESFSIGELNPNCQARLIAEDGVTDITKPGQRGEIWVMGPNVMKGYWRKPEATAETITPDGWLKTGDIAYFDESHKFYIVDRKKELIKVKGNQVAPAELEALLLDHPAIADVAVIGIAAPDGEERPRAYVTLSTGMKATEEEILKWEAERVARYKRLTGGVRFVQAIPKNPSGKILRNILRDQAKAESGRESRL